MWRKVFSAALPVVGKKDCNVGGCCQQCVHVARFASSAAYVVVVKAVAQMPLALVMLWACVTAAVAHETLLLMGGWVYAASVRDSRA